MHTQDSVKQAFYWTMKSELQPKTWWACLVGDGDEVQKSRSKMTIWGARAKIDTAHHNITNPRERHN